MVNSQENLPRVFFDPWVSLDYYYQLLPLLPLVYDRVYVYYPSDRWVESTASLSPTSRDRYRREYIHWISEGVVVPVVKGDYPFVDDIPATRRENDGPSDTFVDALRKIRAAADDKWVIVDRDSTEQGRAEASQIVGDLGGATEVAQALDVRVDRAAIPDLAYFYAGSNIATVKTAAVETVASYLNDDRIRRELRLGEYLLPPTRAYQYRALYDLLDGTRDDDVCQSAAVASAMDAHAVGRSMRLGYEWPKRDSIKQWRDLGLHSVLREFLASEVECHCTADAQPTETAQLLADSLDKLRDELPVELATILLKNDLLWTILLAFSTTASGFVSGGGLAGLATGATGSVVIGGVGKKLIRLALNKIRWHLLVDEISRSCLRGATPGIRRFALGFGEASVFGVAGK